METGPVSMPKRELLLKRTPGPKPGDNIHTDKKVQNGKEEVDAQQRGQDKEYKYKEDEIPHLGFSDFQIIPKFMGDDGFKLDKMLKIARK